MLTQFTRRQSRAARRAYYSCWSATRAYGGAARGNVAWQDVRLARGAVRRRAIQKPFELAQLIELLKPAALTAVAEIGTAHGGTFWLWCRLASPEALILSLDLPGEFAGGGGTAEETIPVLHSFARDTQEVALIREDSHTATAVREVNQALGVRRLDFLFIDGDHSYAGVKKDFEAYAPLVRSGGLIALHDVLPQPSSEVNRFWREVTPEFETLEFVDPSDKRGGVPWGGIGVIRWP